MESPMKRLILLALMTITTFVSADTLTLKPGHPDSYVVKKGDTLWDISGYFLKDPWLWPKLWGANPQIANPHLIYPGDQLTLVFIDGQPRLVRKPQLHKSPEGRKVSKDNAIPLVDLALIQPYLVQNRVVDAEWLAQQPMVLGGESESRHHVETDIIYVNADLPVGNKVGIYAQGREFVSKDEGQPLGQEAILTASGRVVEAGPVSKVKLLSNLRETKAGYRVLPIEDEALMSAYFMPRPANLAAPAYVLAMEKDYREAGRMDVVYFDKGNADGVEAGQVFAIYRDGDTVVINNDGVPVPSSERSTYDELLASLSSERAIQVPDIYRGRLLVFKTFDKVSMGLIMLNERPVRVFDKLIAPDSLALRDSDLR